MFLQIVKIEESRITHYFKVYRRNLLFGCSNVTVTIKGKITKCDVYAFYKVRNCKIVLKTAAAKKEKGACKSIKKGKIKRLKSNNPNNIAPFPQMGRGGKQ